MPRVVALLATAAALATRASACYAPGERSQSEYGYPTIKSAPCCDGSVSVSRTGQWGRFCPETPVGGDGYGYGNGAVAAPKEEKVKEKKDAETMDTVNESAECYSPGERNEGESGYPSVAYKPCCDARKALKMAGQWGKFCPGGTAITDTDCYKEGERNQGEPGYPAVQYKPCCDGLQARKVIGEWGMFCPGGKAITDANCYKKGERNQGAPGYPAVQYKPCCDGEGSVKVKGEWGRFCPGGKAIVDAPTPGSGGSTVCYEKGERNQGAPGYPGVPYAPCCDGREGVTVKGEWGRFCPGSKAITGNDCYKKGERNQGESGYPAVPYKPCCDGENNVKMTGEWGRFCPGAAPIVDVNCYKPGERNQGESGYPAVQYKPCCDGARSVTKYGAWGRFCPITTPSVETSAVPPSTRTPITLTTREPTETFVPVTLPSSRAPATRTTREPTETFAPVSVPSTLVPTAQTTRVPTETVTPVTTVPNNPVPTTAAPVTAVPNTPAPTTAAPANTAPDECEGVSGRPRPDAGSISQADWNLYVSGINGLKSKPSTRYAGISVLDEYSRIHQLFGQHGGANFLMWHRVFLFEFEKELNSVAPGCRIPAYDWSREGNNALSSALYQDNRAGGSEPFVAGDPKPILGGSFEGLTTEAEVTNNEQLVLRNFCLGQGCLAEALHSTEALTGSALQFDRYAEFNTWLEGVHGNFHVAIGGTMNSLEFSPSEPSFYMHHAFIDKVWRQWQQASGRGNDFGGRQPALMGAEVNLNTPMEPWGTTERDTLQRLSDCVEYENQDGSMVSRSISSVSLPPLTRQEKSSSRSQRIVVKEIAYSRQVVPDVDDETKGTYLLDIAEEKANRPGTYGEKVRRAVIVKRSCVAAMKKLGVSPSFISLWERLEGYRLLVSPYERVNLDDEDVAEEAADTGNTAKSAEEGKAEKAAIENGRDPSSVKGTKENSPINVIEEEIEYPRVVTATKPAPTTNTETIPMASPDMIDEFPAYRS